jgi:hypothetical protein
MRTAKGCVATEVGLVILQGTLWIPCKVPYYNSQGGWGLLAQT